MAASIDLEKSNNQVPSTSHEPDKQRNDERSPGKIFDLIYVGLIK